MATVVVTDPRCLEHRPGGGFPERPERLMGILRELRTAGFEVAEPGAHPATRERLAGLHGDEYVARFERAVARGDGIFDSADNPLSAGTGVAARAAVDSCLHAADLAAAGRSAFAAVRPPGHHAERRVAMGFCYYANAALVAEHLRREHGLSRVALFDFDVHHGNGSQHLFEERADVFYGSVHQFPFYPGTGAAAERGRGDGEGATLNLPLPAGSGDDVYAEAVLDRMLPAIEAFAPEALVISAGFDAWRADPLGGMEVTEEAFRAWGRALGELATRRCGGRLVSVLEGGYDLVALPGLVRAYLEGLAGG